MNPEVDWFFEKDTQWKQEYERLRMLLLECGLTEELKWGCPCYTVNKNNVVLIHGFKDYCALLFHKGVLLKDPEDILVQQTKNVQSARQLRFTNAEEIIDQEHIIQAYVNEAVEVEKSGEEVKMKKTSEFDVPEEFQSKLDENPALEKAFESLTPGRQRGYLLHFSGAKQSKTRSRRVEKSIPDILEGKGLHD
ncbi:MAG: YdeI family protein [Gracilimonas sp.]|uniref:YdeI/OmpD-associated family protein n=1 Tax=Gracilimonas TaxID=649462 RepID=UPI001B266168|nr:YdeI family protein [Gracilimonas sp.]MBO6587337.1 YdeI family protein [Gracilimonas sp.]MBO6614177.1 YdeI family protein [Gracilimonas sp.]